MLLNADTDSPERSGFHVHLGHMLEVDGIYFWMDNCQIFELPYVAELEAH